MQQRNAQLTLAKAKQAAGLDTLEGRLSWHSLRHSAGSVWLTEHGSQFMRQDMPWWDSRSDRTSLTFQSAIQTFHRRKPRLTAEWFSTSWEERCWSPRN